MIFDYEVLIIGHGAAGLALADRLYEKNIKNICVLTEDKMVSTSRCAGSDKQTYYKLDIASPEGDSVRRMAQDMFAGGCMNGSDAFIESAYSLPCFMHLCEAGVPFPRDEYGIYQGYRTDHDNSKRATSCGPLTSKYMTEKLEKKLEARGTAVLDRYKAVKLAVDGGKCYGAYCLNGGEIRLVTARYTALCTGAPASVYYDSVYPIGHNGATGLAVEAGAQLSNFQEWQYGIASKDFRWNLSGSYQQVVPRYISVDENGNEYEFLSELEDSYTKVFLKGYEWPFNSRKTEGSSAVDIAVIGEIAKDRSVYLDYMHNPEGFDFSKLSADACEYLTKAGAVGETPFERLMQLNPKAVDLYKSHGIDLSADMLRIGVCAQHNNGGIRVNLQGETTVENLFCSGEASGRFGVYRPGGAALNDTQAGSLLIAECIAGRKAGENCFNTNFIAPELPVIGQESNVKQTDEYFAKKMSAHAGAIRDVRQIEILIAELTELKNSFADKVKIASVEEYKSYFLLYSTTLSRLSLCRTELKSAKKCGSRGGCVCLENGVTADENEEMRQYITVTDGEEISFVRVDEIPEYECVFEKLLKR